MFFIWWLNLQAWAKGWQWNPSIKDLSYSPDPLKEKSQSGMKFKIRISGTESNAIWSSQSKKYIWILFTLAELLKSSMSVHTLKLCTWVITCESFTHLSDKMHLFHIVSWSRKVDFWHSLVFIVFQSLDFVFGLEDYPFENVSSHICEIWQVLKIDLCFCCKNHNEYTWPIL